MSDAGRAAEQGYASDSPSPEIPAVSDTNILQIQNSEITRAIIYVAQVLYNFNS